MRVHFKKITAIILCVTILFTVSVTSAIPALSATTAELEAVVSEKENAMNVAKENYEAIQSQIEAGIIYSEDFEDSDYGVFAPISDSSTFSTYEVFTETDSANKYLSVTSSAGKSFGLSTAKDSWESVSITGGAEYYISFDIKLSAANPDLRMYACSASAYSENPGTSLTGTAADYTFSNSGTSLLLNGVINTGSDYIAFDSARLKKVPVQEDWYPVALKVTPDETAKYLRFYLTNNTATTSYSFDDIKILTSTAYNLSDELAAAKAAYETAIEDYNSAIRDYEFSIQKSLASGFEFSEGEISDFFTVNANMVPERVADSYMGDYAAKINVTTGSLATLIGTSYEVVEGNEYVFYAAMKTDSSAQQTEGAIIKINGTNVTPSNMTSNGASKSGDINSEWNRIRLTDSYTVYALTFTATASGTATATIVSYATGVNIYFDDMYIVPSDEQNIGFEIGALHGYTVGAKLNAKVQAAEKDAGNYAVYVSRTESADNIMIDGAISKTFAVEANKYYLVSHRIKVVDPIGNDGTNAGIFIKTGSTNVTASAEISSDGRFVNRADGWSMIQTNDSDWHTYNLLVGSGNNTTLTTSYFQYSTGASAYLDEITVEEVEIIADLGDANGDGNIDICDLVRLAIFVDNESVEVNEAADMDGNSDIDESDVISLRHKLLHGYSSAELKVEKVSSVESGSNVSTNDIITYTVTIQNKTARPLSNITYTDTLPEGLAFASGSSGVSCSGSTVSWKGTVDMAGKATITYRVVVTGTKEDVGVIECNDSYIGGIKLDTMTYTIS